MYYKTSKKAKLQECSDAKLKGLKKIASCREDNWFFNEER